MPTERHGKVRRLLRDGKAHVVRLEPFTIQLDYESKGYTQEVSLGVDAGSIHIGLSATTEKKELFSAEVTIRKDIVNLIARRKELRHLRRNRKTRYRKARYNNRKNSNEKFVPSVQYKIDSHLKIIRMVRSLLPIKNIIIEINKFDIERIKNEQIQGVEYQQGEQMGFWNVREYVLARDNHQCQHCNGKSGDKILNVHHLESRKTGGNAPNNLITLCESCHKAYHRGEIQLKQKRGRIFRDATAMNIMRKAIFKKTKEEFGNTSLTYGYITKYNRIKNNIEKSHNMDAFCISGNLTAECLCFIYKMRLIRKHNRQIHKFKIKKGGKRELNQTNYSIYGYRLFDKVVYDNKECFIFGRRLRGSFDIRTIDGETISPYVSYKRLQFRETRKTVLITKVNRLCCRTKCRCVRTSGRN